MYQFPSSPLTTYFYNDSEGMENDKKGGKWEEQTVGKLENGQMTLTQQIQGSWNLSSAGNPEASHSYHKP